MEEEKIVVSNKARYEEGTNAINTRARMYDARS